MRTRKDHRLTTKLSSLANVKSLAVMTGVVAACAAALGGACGDAQPVTSGAGGAGGLTSSAGGMGTGGEDLSVVAGSVTVGSTSSSSSSSSGTPPRCMFSSPTGGGTKTAAAYGDTAIQTGNSITVDKSGNVIMAGAFGGTINFGGTTLTSAGGDDAFIAKFNSGGQLLWAKEYGDGKGQNIGGVGTDGNGNIYITGNFTGSINFGGGALTAAGTLFTDVFVAKLTADGNHVWSKSFGDDEVQNSYGLAVDAASNVIIAGSFKKTIGFGGGTLNAGGSFVDVFVAKFNGDGAHQWSRQYGVATSDQIARAVAADAAGNIYVGGEVAESIDFGGGSKSVTTTKSAFVAKLDSLGNAAWVNLSDGDANSIGVVNSVAVGPNGEVAAGGYFKGMFDLGGMPVSSIGTDDAFITLFAAGGSHTVTKVFGDAEQQEVVSLAFAPNGEVFAAGDFSGAIDFETGMAFTSTGASDGFVVRLNANGCPAWLKTFTGPMGQLPKALAFDPTTSGVAVTGQFIGASDFGTGVTMSAGIDAFLVSVNP
ncbi:MAG TPA: SBBP repeat-containing protein [Polyangium sp.]|nr:SBBP repeat-containing protein [Polyangium sp.]